MFRQMDVPAEWVAEGDTGALPQMLGTDLNPEEARELQGTMGFFFPELEVDALEIFEIPGIVDWLEIIHARIPHLVYFLDPNVMTGSLEGLLRSLLPPDERTKARGEGGISLPQKMLVGLTMHLLAAAAYATDKGDDWEPIVTAFVAPLDKGAQDALIETVRESLAGT